VNTDVFLCAECDRTISKNKDNFVNCVYMYSEEAQKRGVGQDSEIHRSHHSCPNSGQQSSRPVSKDATDTHIVIDELHHAVTTLDLRELLFKTPAPQNETRNRHGQGHRRQHRPANNQQQQPPWQPQIRCVNHPLSETTTSERAGRALQGTLSSAGRLMPS
jgi:hypothetical protein